MRKELADMKNQLNWQKKRNDELRKNKASGPKGYQRYDVAIRAVGIHQVTGAADMPAILRGGTTALGQGAGPGYNQPPRRERSQEPVDRATAANSTRPTGASVTRKPFFLPEILILKTIRPHDSTTVLKERQHLEIVIRSVPDSVSFFLDQTD
jgi:hypothetical protein